MFPKDRVSLFPSRWLAVAASEGKHSAAWPPDPQKPFVFLRKTSIFAKSLFCIQRWLGSCLETSCGRLGATRKGQGEGQHAPQRKVLISKNLQKSLMLRGRPRVPRRWPPARLTAYLQCPVRRPDRLHIYRVGGPRAPSHPVNMQSICSAADRGLEGAQTELFPLPGGSRRARRGPKKKF